MTWWLWLAAGFFAGALVGLAVATMCAAAAAADRLDEFARLREELRVARLQEMVDLEHRGEATWLH